MPLGPERIVLITGASRGIGAQVALQLATPGTHVLVNHRKSGDRAASIAQAIRDVGGQASTIAADISEEADVTAMMDTIRARFGRLDALILNASDGRETGADPEYAMRLNRDAQKRLATLAMPLMSAGARIVFVTSHQAHFFPHKAVPKGYAAVAVSKRAGESALYAMRPEFVRAGIGFTVVSGDMVDDTIVMRAAAIAQAATTAPSPGIVYVGRADYLTTA